MCLYGFGNVETWGKKSGHIWRTTGDIKDRWPSMLVNIDINDEKRFTSNQGPKIGWNYPDALFVGKEIQMILRLFLVCHLLLQTKSVPSQPASNVGGLVKFMEMARSGLTVHSDD